MTDAHYHSGMETLLSFRGKEYRFLGVHPWNAESAQADEVVRGLRDALANDSAAGVGEIGLDRLKVKSVTQRQREVFMAQLEIAADMRRPVVLHGAKCWGEVVKAVRPYAGMIPSFLFHGFSRSAGLVPELVSLNGFVGVGKAVLNDHAVNYRELVKGLPVDRLLVETDVDADRDVRNVLVAEIFAKVIELTGITERQIEDNCARLLGALHASETHA